MLEAHLGKADRFSSQLRFKLLDRDDILIGDVMIPHATVIRIQANRDIRAQGNRTMVVAVELRLCDGACTHQVDLYQSVMPPH